MNEDDELWRAVTESVKPLEKKRDKVNKPPIKEIIIHKKDFSDHIDSEKNYGTLICGESSHVDKNTSNKLQKGEIRIDAKLDLHEKTQDVAFDLLNDFIRNSFEDKKRCLLIVTGKGKDGEGVLKKQVPSWLNKKGLREYIIMFSVANMKHGGQGALYVLLKKNKK